MLDSKFKEDVIKYAEIKKERIYSSFVLVDKFFHGRNYAEEISIKFHYKVKKYMEKKGVVFFHYGSKQGTRTRDGARYYFKNDKVYIIPKGQIREDRFSLNLFGRTNEPFPEALVLVENKINNTIQELNRITLHFEKPVHVEWFSGNTLWDDCKDSIFIASRRISNLSNVADDDYWNAVTQVLTDENKKEELRQKADQVLKWLDGDLEILAVELKLKG